MSLINNNNKSRKRQICENFAEKDVYLFIIFFYKEYLYTSYGTPCIIQRVYI